MGFTTLQPSELQVRTYDISCGIRSENPPDKFKQLIVPLISGLGMCVLIVLEPNMSITICVATGLLIMLYVAGTPKNGLSYCLFLPLLPPSF